jgi:hypothetical protein
MRSIWLASAAIIMTAGIAAAQTTSPAPTGAPNAPTETPAGSTASPGNGGTSNNMAGPSTAMTAPSNASGMGAPAPTGAPQAPENSPNPAISPGNNAPSGSTNMAPPMTNKAAATKPVHHGMGGMMVPENASAERYLHIASDAIKHHNKTVADDALSHAETRLLTRAVPASSNMSADDSPRISAIESARKALSSGDYQTAAMDTHQAMHGHMDAK